MLDAFGKGASMDIQDAKDAVYKVRLSLCVCVCVCVGAFVFCFEAEGMQCLCWGQGYRALNVYLLTF